MADQKKRPPTAEEVNKMPTKTHEQVKARLTAIGEWDRAERRKK